MSEPSSGVPKEIVDAEVEDKSPDEPERVELDLDQDKLDAWDDVKGDYELAPGGKPVPNSQQDDLRTPAGDGDQDDQDGRQDDEPDDGEESP